jgi:hypothetical protein
MNKDKVIYYQQHGWLTGATDSQFSLGQLQTTAWNYSPTILNQRNWQTYHTIYLANG